MARGYVICRAALGAIEDHYTARGLTLPDRRVLQAGQAVYDDEQLSVTLVGYYTAANLGPGYVPGVEQHRNFRWDGVEFEIALIRCAPNITELAQGAWRLPNPDEYDRWVASVDDDLEHLVWAMSDALNGGTFGEAPNATIVLADAYLPSGELGGAIVRFRIGR